MSDKPKYLVFAEVAGLLDSAQEQYHRVQGHRPMRDGDTANCVQDAVCDRLGDVRIEILKMLEDTT